MDNLEKRELQSKFNISRISSSLEKCKGGELDELRKQTTGFLFLILEGINFQEPEGDFSSSEITHHIYNMLPEGNIREAISEVYDIDNSDYIPNSNITSEYFALDICEKTLNLISDLEELDGLTIEDVFDRGQKSKDKLTGNQWETVLNHEFLCSISVDNLINLKSAIHAFSKRQLDGTSSIKNQEDRLPMQLKKILSIIEFTDLNVSCMNRSIVKIIRSKSGVFKNIDNRFIPQE